MTNHPIIPESVTVKFEVFDWRNAAAILSTVHTVEFEEIIQVLDGFVLKHSDIATGGGNKSPVSKGIDSRLYDFGWKEKKFDTKFVVDGFVSESPTHSVDCFKGKVALEVEWNNKDPFFDRDLNNFRLLYDLRVIDLGIIITRAISLEEVLKNSGRVQTTYGKSTTRGGSVCLNSLGQFYK